MKFFFVLLFGKIEIIKLFCFRGEYELFLICISIYIFSLSCDFFINALLFSDDVISQKYNNGGEISPVTTYLLSILSNILSLFISSMMFKLTNYSFLFEFIASYSNTKTHLFKHLGTMIPCIKAKLFIYFTLSFTFSLGFMYYLICFCNLYKASQVNWFTNSITSLIISFLTTLGISLVIALCRYIGLKCHSKKFYNMSLYLNK